MTQNKEVSKSVLKRLPGYLVYLKNLPEDAPAHISATALAAALGMGEVQVRKDLALVSDGGRPKIGYLRSALVEDIEAFLGYDNTTDAIIVGAGKPVYPVDNLQSFCKRNKVLMGIITVPAAHAQEVADRMIECGIKAIWNFAPVHLEAPSHILIQNQNMATNLAVLSMHLRAQMKPKKDKE